MRFGILGPLDVRTDTGEYLAVGGPRPRALLTILLLNAGRVVSVEQLIDGQYGEDPPAGAANAIQAQVSRLRKHLPVEFDGVGYRLAIDPLDVDVHRFQQLAGDGRRLLASGGFREARGLLREAVDLWRGPALVDVPFAQAQLAWLEELRLAASEDLVEAELALPEGTSVAELQRLVAEHPLRERLVGLLMRALHAAGRPAEALSVFDETRRLLVEELGVDPSPELAEIHLDILRAEKPRRHGVAAQLTSFVGRERELEALGDARLITLVGPGGVGKTRLAVEAARRSARETCFADLSPISEHLDQAVLTALGVRNGGVPGMSPVDRLVTALSDRELLLILDNCEHVIDAAAALARRLLAECPGLSLLATSREPLGLTGETIMPLAPLGTASAIRLFADRAAAVRQGFELTGDNLDAVSSICATLDGLPLAIELAAARLRFFPVEEIAARLIADGRFRLLSRGDRTAAARHQTLHAVVEWSWDLLSAEEQELATRFSVFAGGASLDAVEAICGDITDLVDKSLVVAEGGRYRMFETIRLFCASGLTDDIRAEHARYYLQLAQEADPHLRRAEQLVWLARLSDEYNNLMAALRHDPETGQRMVAALAAYWWLSGRRSGAGELASGLLELRPGLEEEYVACVLHAVPHAAPEHWERATEILRSRRRPLRHPFLAPLWGMLVGPVGFEADAPFLSGDPWSKALERLGNALLIMHSGDPAKAERELSEVLDQFRNVGERWGTAQAMDGLAVLASWRGQWERAGELWREAMAMLEELGSVEECAQVLGRWAEARLRQGRPEVAVRDFRRADEYSRQAGLPAVSLLGLARAARLQGDLDEARRLLETAPEPTEGFGLEGQQARRLTELARLERAGELHREAVSVAKRSFMVADLAAAVEGLAEAMAPKQAALLLGIAVALRGTALAGDPDVAGVAAEATAAIGAEAFAEQFGTGAAMSREDALTVIEDAVSG
ncbi:BTAD domain-containing putative transcriptional regulator [Microbispora bryophytorum]|uniref:BTAD domain-containing putative transcriptional regulator n=1 Tax=Microbispora bryophytorum TaxID=1460882 RepID=UPI003409776F